MRYFLVFLAISLIVWLLSINLTTVQRLAYFTQIEDRLMAALSYICMVLGSCYHMSVVNHILIIMKGLGERSISQHVGLLGKPCLLTILLFTPPIHTHLRFCTLLVGIVV